MDGIELGGVAQSFDSEPGAGASADESRSITAAEAFGLPPPVEVARLPIYGWAGYYAGDDGRIYSIKSGDFEPVAIWENRGGYLCVTLYRRGAKKNFRIHTLIAKAFLPRRRRRSDEVRHKDGNQKNNVPSNLKWGTRRQNEKDKLAVGTAPRGENNGRRKLRKQDADQIRDSKAPTRALVEEFGISQSQVRKIRAGAAWAST